VYATNKFAKMKPHPTFTLVREAGIHHNRQGKTIATFASCRLRNHGSHNLFPPSCIWTNCETNMSDL